MKKKLLCLGLALLFTVPFFSACGKKGSSTIRVAYVTLGTTPAELSMVQEEVNRIIEPKIDVKIELVPLSYTEMATKYVSWVGSQEIDVMMFGLFDPATFISQNMVKSLDNDLLSQYAPEVVELVGEGFPLYLKHTDNKVYGISTLEKQYGYGGSYVIKKSVLEAVGLDETYTDRDRIDYDDLDTIFAAVKGHSPTTYPSGNLVDVSHYFMQFDHMGATTASGVLMLNGDNDTEVVNYFETPEFKAYKDKVGAWKTAGYIHPDASVTDTSMFELLESNVFCGVYLDHWESLKQEYETRVSEEMVQLYINDLYYRFGKPNLNRVIASNSTKVAPALKYINLMTTNVELMNTLQWGIKGHHFEFSDEENGLIKFPEGVTSANSGYFNSLGLYGDKRQIYAWGAQMDAERQAFLEREAKMTETALANSSPAVGFLYNPAGQTTRILAIEAKITQYLRSIGTGNAGSYNAFIADLNSAGIATVIADKQQQFNAWLAAQ